MKVSDLTNEHKGRVVRTSLGMGDSEDLIIEHVEQIPGYTRITKPNGVVWGFSPNTPCYLLEGKRS